MRFEPPLRSGSPVLTVTLAAALSLRSFRTQRTPRERTGSNGVQCFRHHSTDALPPRLAEPDDETVGRNLSILAGEIQRLAIRPLWREITWVFCDWCGCSVDTDLIHPDGHHYFDDGGFYCADC
jgi:hypothetical protein